VTAPFGLRVLPVHGRRELGPYVVLEARDEQAAAEPGQFYMLSAEGRWGGGEDERPFLARAVSVMRVGDAGDVEFLLEDVGPGTKRLCELGPGEALSVLGPLGRGFSAPATDGELVLVGGGIGIAPLLAAQERWGGRALLGFRDTAHAAGAGPFADAQVATDDGSVGHHGLVTELLKQVLERRSATVYACGPPAMLTAVGALALARGAPCELALEAPMACGFGACWGCAVATRDGYRRVCVDGPVFAAQAMR
jgi:dihydroorotate dehydrogenase electron transfer subunit